MHASDTGRRPNSAPISFESRAEALWEFVCLSAPRFTIAGARQVVSRLAGFLEGDPKLLAKQLKIELAVHGIKTSHSNTLKAASKLQGWDAWHSHPHKEVALLTFTGLDRNIPIETDYASWDELAKELREWVDSLRTRGQLPLDVLSISLSPHALSFTTMVRTEAGVTGATAVWPLGIVSPVSPGTPWLDGAPAALEKLRRHLESNGHAVLDGYAVLRLCDDPYAVPGHPTSVSMTDAVNTELVLQVEQDEDDPSSSYEIARGNELYCWHQLELSLRKSTAAIQTPLTIDINEEGSGAWLINGMRYVWVLETLKPNEIVPGRIVRYIGIDDCKRLRKRYEGARKIRGDLYMHRDYPKEMAYDGGPSEYCRVNLHFVLLRLDKLGLNWDSYLEKFGLEPTPMVARLPTGFVYQLIENLKLERPNDIFSLLSLSEMQLVEESAWIRAIRPRIQHLRYVQPQGMDDVDSVKLKEVMEDFAHGLYAQLMTAGKAATPEDELPHLVWAAEAEELWHAVEALGLVMYAAVMPHLTATKGIVVDVPGVNMSPWAYGHALFLRFAVKGGAA